MHKGLLKRILVLALTLVMILGSSVDMYAKAKDTQYISDIQMGYGDSGKKALTNAGYTIWENLNANEGGNGDAVWIGYKTTEDATEAITDISIMHMGGEYSYGAWTEKVKTVQANVNSLVKRIVAAVAEFKENYNNDNEYAKRAYEILDRMYEDDSKQTVAEFLTNDATTTEALNNMILWGNQDLVAIMEQALAIACTDTNEKSFIEILNEAHYTGTINYENNADRNACLTAIKELAAYLDETVVIKESYAEIVENSDIYATIDDYVETLSYIEQDEYFTHNSILSIAQNTKFGDTGLTLYSFAMTDEKLITDEYLELLVDAMTEGQRGVVDIVGLDYLLLLADGRNNEDTMEGIDNLLNTFDEEEIETISFYSGVDRSIYTDYETVAMTTDAMRLDGKSENSVTFGTKKDYYFSYAVRVAMPVMAAVCTGIVLAAKYLSQAEWFIEKYGVYMDPDGIVRNYSCSANSLTGTTAGTVLQAVIIVAVVLVVIFLIMTLVSQLVKKTVKGDINYLEIPRVLIDAETADSEEYTIYYAVKNAGASAQETSSLTLYGDLNAMNKSDEWFVPYYTKDTDAGLPITTDMLVKSSADASLTGYTALHEFGSTAAVDLNKYCSKEGHGSIYVYLRTVDANAETGSVFSNSTFILGSVGSFILGGAIAAVVTYTKTKKRRPTEA